MVSFDEHVRRALDGLPDDLARGLRNVAVAVEDENPEEPDLFGLFEEDDYLPAKVTIYRLPLEESFPDPGDLEREIRITVLHELAHYFGMDEERLERLWDEQRMLKARARFGDREEIIKRARHEERLARAA